MIHILLRALIGVAVGASTIAVYNVITKSNLAEKIKKVFSRGKYIEIEDENPLEEIIKKKQENSETLDVFFGIISEVQSKSVSVNVFYGNARRIKMEEVTVVADKVADDIEEGYRISLMN